MTPIRVSENFRTPVLVISGDLENEPTIEALFEAGCDDATFGSVDRVGYGDFVREAPSLAAAVGLAIEQVESVPGLRVERIEPEDLVTMSEIAERMGRSRESVRLWITGARGPGGFPAPVSHLRARSRLWRWSEVTEWAAQTSTPVDCHAAALIAAINAALTIRQGSSQLATAERKFVVSLT